MELTSPSGTVTPGVNASIYPRFSPGPGLMAWRHDAKATFLDLPV